MIQGAEAQILLNEKGVVKARLEKGYRHPDLDRTLRRSRTKSEAKILKILFDAGIPVPSIHSVDEFSISMEQIDGDKLRDVLEPKHGVLLGKLIRALHNVGIIHGDLSTSNVLVRGEELVLIDFGLSFFANALEHKAVDLHVLEQILFSTHTDCAQQVWENVLSSYGDEAVLKRLDVVRSRGRNKGK